MVQSHDFWLLILLTACMVLMNMPTKKIENAEK